MKTLDEMIDDQLGLNSDTEWTTRVYATVKCSKCGDEIMGRTQNTGRAVCINCKAERIRSYTRSEYQELKGKK